MYIYIYKKKKPKYNSLIKINKCILFNIHIDIFIHDTQGLYIYIYIYTYIIYIYIHIYRIYL